MASSNSGLKLFQNQYTTHLLALYTSFTLKYVEYIPLLHSLLAGGTLSDGSGLACIVSKRFPHVGGGDGIILKSMSDLDLDGSASLTCGTTGSAGGGKERDGEEEELVAAMVLVVPPGREVAREEEVEEGGRDWLDGGAGIEGGPLDDAAPAVDVTCMIDCKIIKINKASSFSYIDKNCT